MSAQSELNDRVKALNKIFGLSAGEKMSRRAYENYATKHKEVIEKINPIEAIYGFAGIMHIADSHGFTKYPEDGGHAVTAEEHIALISAQSVEKTKFFSHISALPLFRAIDADGDGFISRDEWVHHLKALQTYENEEQAVKSFNSLDTNQDNRISWEEYLQGTLKFWADLVLPKNLKNFYGTADK